MTEEATNTNNNDAEPIFYTDCPYMAPDKTITDEEWEIQQNHIQRPQYRAYTPKGRYLHVLLEGLKVMRMRTREELLVNAGWHFNERVKGKAGREYDDEKGATLTFYSKGKVAMLSVTPSELSGTIVESLIYMGLLERNVEKEAKMLAWADDVAAKHLAATGDLSTMMYTCTVEGDDLLAAERDDTGMTIEMFPVAKMPSAAATDDDDTKMSPVAKMPPATAADDDDTKMPPPPPRQGKGDVSKPKQRIILLWMVVDRDEAQFCLSLGGLTVQCECVRSMVPIRIHTY